MRRSDEPMVVDSMLREKVINIGAKVMRHGLVAIFDLFARVAISGPAVGSIRQ